jgi:hypothetical protein
MMVDNNSWMDPYLTQLEQDNPKGFYDYVSLLAKEKESAQILAHYNGTSEELLAEIAKTHASLRSQILLHPNCPRELIGWAIGAENRALAYEVIKSPLSISGSELHRLWERGDIAVKVATTSRKDCPADLIMDTWKLDFSDDSLFENNREEAMKNIASHPNIPKKLIVEFMRYPLDTIFDGNVTLGHLLLQNPSIPDETRALLALRGVQKQNQENKTEAKNLMSRWPSTQVYKFRKIDQGFRDLFSSLAHPESLLDIREKLSNARYDATIVLSYWISDESSRIYKCLWPELANNPKTHIFYSASTYEGDHSYVGVEGGLDLSDEKFRNKIGGSPSWIKSSNTLSYDEVNHEIANRGFNDFLESEPTDEIIISAAIRENLSQELYSITESGEKYIQEAGNDWFQDDVTYLADVKPDPSQKVWSELDETRQQVIFSVIKSAVLEDDEDCSSFAQYLGALLAMNPNISVELRKELAELPSELIRQALNV